MIILKTNTTYKIEKGKTNWIIFSRTIERNKKLTSLVESLSININTHEVYCNRTGKQTFGIRRYLKLVLRIEKIFNLSSLRDF